ncbi:hypothetical protein [Planctomycetes bacterium TBK1r]|uniref:hypothetical protein n=1 Tax=Stieleria magnilauensis TaxID=2527963 RepID=UPI0011A91B76
METQFRNQNPIAECIGSWLAVRLADADLETRVVLVEPFTLALDCPIGDTTSNSQSAVFDSKVEHVRLIKNKPARGHGTLRGFDSQFGDMAP